MQKQKNEVPSSSEPHVVIKRVLNHSREQIYEAWTNPRYLLKWYAPKGCTIRFTKIDAREGGSFHSCISNPDFDCWVIGEYLELKRPERIVQTMIIADESGKPAAPSSVGHDPDWTPKTTLVITLKELGPNKTELVLEQDVSEKLAGKTGAYSSWLDMLDNLDALISSARDSGGLK
jgi:uncharacterized protein YndB with AHSA1/START domain